MTAGRGIIHNEYHSTEFAKSGGELDTYFSFIFPYLCQILVGS
jgi:redox-sensitive bicupin YhaK (pirin superfamily)